VLGKYLEKVVNTGNFSPLLGRSYNCFLIFICHLGP